MNINNTINYGINRQQFNASNINAQNVNNQKIDETKVDESKVLGFSVDKNGYFGSDFNKAAGIDESVKINANAINDFVKNNTTSHNKFANFDSIDIAKSVKNAYDKLGNANGSDITKQITSALNDNPSLISGNVSYMGRLNGLDPTMSADEFKLQIGLTIAEYGDVTKISDEDYAKMSDYQKDIVDFAKNVKNSNQSQKIDNPVASMYRKMNDEQREIFGNLQESAKESIMIGLSRATKPSSPTTAFDSSSILKQTQELKDFTNYFMKNHNFFNGLSLNSPFNNMQQDLSNAFLNLYQQQIYSPLNILA